MTLKSVAGVSALALAATMTTYADASPADARRTDHIAGTSCRTFPADNYWHAKIGRLPVNKRSKVWLSHMSAGNNLHPDFGPSFGDGPNYGIPITVVTGSHARVKVRFDYSSESDHLRYPLGKDTRIEPGDRHAIVVDKTHCRLYETYATRLKKGTWYAGSGATWSLTGDRLRPDGWTSADAAGLPILPGLLRWNEVKEGYVDHAIRFTTDVTSTHHIWPARHDAGSKTSRSYPPMGARFRLKKSFSTHGFSHRAKVVLTAMKTYGLVLADNGSPWYFQGERNSHWPDRLVEDLKRIPASAFVAVDTSSLKVSKNSGRAQ
jgi:hypothetical protein